MIETMLRISHLSQFFGWGSASPVKARSTQEARGHFNMPSPRDCKAWNLTGDMPSTGLFAHVLHEATMLQGTLAVSRTRGPAIAPGIFVRVQLVLMTAAVKPPLSKLSQVAELSK